MFSSKSKLDNNLKYYVSKNAYKNYRVLIKYKNNSILLLGFIRS